MGGSRYPSAKYLHGSSPAPEKPLRVYKDKIDGPLTKTSVGLYGGTWIHPLVAEAYAIKCGLNLEHFQRRTSDTEPERTLILKTIPTTLDETNTDVTELVVRYRRPIILANHADIPIRYGCHSPGSGWT
jgi:hypothetical protein